MAGANHSDALWHRADSQHGLKACQRGAAWLDRVRSALTQQVKRAVAMKPSIHEAYPAVPGGRLRFLGSMTGSRL